ncbi:MAG: inorganic phosphate transporter, partial [Flavobacteriales bacterium]
MILFALALIFGLYMAWSIGANDVANAMGTSVGSGALTLKRAVIVAAVLEFSGAFFVGSHVSETVRKGIIDTDIFMSQPMFLVYGMLAALLAAAVWLQVASYYGWPVSTTHSIVGAIIGFGVVVGGMSAVHWAKVGTIVSSWVISPLLSGVIAFAIFSILRKRIFHSSNPVRQAKKTTPFIVFFVFAILTLVLVFKGLKNLHLDLPIYQAILLACGIGLAAAFVSFLLVRKIKDVYDETFESPRPSVQTIYGLKKAEKHLTKALLTAHPEIKDGLSSLLGEVQAMSAGVNKA